MSQRVKLTRGFWAVVDDADYEAVAQYRWHARVDRHHIYAGRNARQDGGGYVTERMHTFLTGWPRVDHIDGNGLNNQRSNLRPASAAENNRNARKHSAGYSQYKGVSWCKRERRWFAQIQHDRQHRHLGYFGSELEAAYAYDAAAAALFGEFAWLNRAPQGVS
jgi:hypothetical protein